MNQRKQDLERRLKLANNDKSNLNVLLEETSDKILLLENLLNEKDGKLNELLDEINELRDSSSWLSNELESMIIMNEKLSTNSTSLLNSSSIDNNEKETIETKLGSELAACQRKRSQLVEQLKELRLRNQSRLKASEFMKQQAKNKQNSNDLVINKRSRRRLIDKQRGDESLFAEMSNMVMLKGDRPASADLSGSSPDLYDHDDEEGSARNGFELNAQLLVEIYKQLQNFYTSLQLRKESFAINNSNSSGNSSAHHHHASSANNSHLYSPNSTDDSGISGDDSK